MFRQSVNGVRSLFQRSNSYSKQQLLQCNNHHLKHQFTIGQASFSTSLFNTHVKSSSIFSTAIAQARPQSAPITHTRGFAAKTRGQEKTPLRRVTGKIVRFKPITPSLRHTVLIDRSELWKGGPIKQLTVPKKKSGGRGHGGKISVRHRGGGHKQKYRLVDFKRSIVDMPAIVQRLEYDPNRTGYIALIRYEDGSLSYILSPHGLKPGDVVQSSRQQEIDVQPGNAMPLSRIPVGTWIHNIELTPGKGGQMARSAGAACQLMDKSGKEGYGLVRLASKEQRYILLSCMATVGSMSNPLHRLRKLGKAGRARWMGRRPTVRGVAMNPVDHPHGGGEGRGKGRHSCSPTGILSKGGFKTRKKPKSKLVIVPRGGLKKGMSA